MKIKNDSSQKNTAIIVVSLLSILLIVFFLSQEKNVYQTDSNGKSEVSHLNERTELARIKAKNFTYEALMSNEKLQLYKEEGLVVYATEKSGILKLIYAYEDEISGRKLTDNFFLHAYLKDSTKNKGNVPYINLDFANKPMKINSKNKDYFIFQRDLSSEKFVGEHLQINDIKHINTGRFRHGIGRSLSINKLTIPDSLSSKLQVDLPKIHITTSAKNYNKIREKRKQALEIGVLSSEDDDLVKGDISFNYGALQKAKFRLKGDWPDHLRHQNKWSYRFIMEDGNTFKGMRKFSIQHPRVRNYLWEWLFNKILKEEDIIGLRYDFADVTMDVQSDTVEHIPIGIMALEESFDKILIEHNRRREGVILAFDESLFWDDTKKEKEFRLDHNTYSKKIRSLENAPIKVFNQNKVLSDPNLSKQFNTAKDLLDGLKSGKHTLSNVFDIDKLTTYVATSYLFGGNHGLVWHNLRIYYNPITSKLEPISYDSNSGIKLETLRPFPFSESDSIFKHKLREKLKIVSSQSYIENLMSTYSEELERLERNLFAEYNIEFDHSILAYNSNYIKKTLQPARQITAQLVAINHTNVSIAIKNLSDHPVIIEGIEHEDGRVLSINQSQSLIPLDGEEIVHFTLDNYFKNAFVSKKNKKGAFQYPKDVGKIKIAHHIPGIDVTNISEILPYGTNQNLDNSIAMYKKSRAANYDSFDFVQKTSDSTLSFKKGQYTLTENLVVPANFRIEIPAGFELDFQNQASFISHSPIICIGTKENPIRLYSSDSSGGGIFITNTTEKSVVSHSIFDNLSNPQSELWSVSGAVNFHESEVHISHTTFSNNRCEDGLNIIRSTFTMTDTRFEGTYSDAFDGDFVTGTLERCTFLNAGNDGIDISGSELVIKDIIIENPADKGISAGEHSSIYGANVSVTGGEIGVVSKDLSTINLTDLTISGTRLGLSAFQKKSEYGVATIDINNLLLDNVEVNHLIEIDSRLSIDKVTVETVSNNVIDQMYGKEYGKSSK